MEPVKRLYRSRSDRIVAGVCAGLAEFFSLDPTLIRLIFIVLFLMGAIGVWPYLVLWIVVPEQP